MVSASVLRCVDDSICSGFSFIRLDLSHYGTDGHISATEVK